MLAVRRIHTSLFTFTSVGEIPRKAVLGCHHDVIFVSGIGGPWSLDGGGVDAPHRAGCG